MLLGLPAEGGSLHQALQSCVLTVRFLVFRIRATAGPPLPFLWRDTEGNKVFFWGVVGCLLWNGSLLWVFCSSAPLSATASARFVDVHPPPRNWDLPKSLGWGLSWVEDVGAQPEGQWEGAGSPHHIGPLEMSWAGSPNPGAGKQPNQGIRVCLIQEGPVEGKFAHRAVITLMLIFFVLFYKSSEMFAKWVLLFFFVIPLSLLKGECVFLWEE